VKERNNQRSPPPGHTPGGLPFHSCVDCFGGTNNREDLVRARLLQYYGSVFNTDNKVVLGGGPGLKTRSVWYRASLTMFLVHGCYASLTTTVPALQFPTLDDST
jgi:hypothetical protein